MGYQLIHVQTGRERCQKNLIFLRSSKRPKFCGGELTLIIVVRPWSGGAQTSTPNAK
jgi:hypothetical protein